MAATTRTRLRLLVRAAASTPVRGRVVEPGHDQLGVRGLVDAHVPRFQPDAAVEPREAQEAGAVRRELRVADLIGLLAGTSRAIEYAGQDATARDRILAVILDGLRAR